MAGVAELPSRLQLAAIAQVRWRVFAHSIRSKGGALEFASRLFVGTLLAIGGIVGAFGLGAGARMFVLDGRVEWIAVLLWSVFVFWLLFPIMGSVFTETAMALDGEATYVFGTSPEPPAQFFRG